MAVRLAAKIDAKYWLDYNTRLTNMLASRFGAATADVVLRAKQDLRRDTSAVLGPRMAKTWRGKVYPVERPARTLKPAGLVYSSAANIAAAFDPPATIVAKVGMYLAIPTDNVPKRLGSFRMTPSQLESYLGQDLEIVPSRTKGVFLMVAQGRASGGKKTFGRFRRADASRRAKGAGIASYVMFIMVRRVRLKTRLNWRAIMARYESVFSEEIGAAASLALRAA